MLLSCLCCNGFGVLGSTVSAVNFLLFLNGSGLLFRISCGILLCNLYILNLFLDFFVSLVVFLTCDLFKKSVSGFNKLIKLLIKLFKLSLSCRNNLWVF